MREVDVYQQEPPSWRKIVETSKCIEIKCSELDFVIGNMGNPFAASLETGVTSVINFHSLSFPQLPIEASSMHEYVHWSSER